MCYNGYSKKKYRHASVTFVFGFYGFLFFFCVGQEGVDLVTFWFANTIALANPQPRTLCFAVSSF